jgi:hypothetical protein
MCCVSNRVSPDTSSRICGALGALCNQLDARSPRALVRPVIGMAARVCV